MSISISDPNVLVLQNTTTRVTIEVRDSTVTPAIVADPYMLRLQMMDIGGTVEIDDTWPGTPLRIVRSGIGRFYVDIGNQSPNSETSSPAEWVLNWQVQMANGSETINTIQKIKVISVRSASILPDFRQMIDKTHKIVDTANECFLGYTDGQLFSYLEGGLQNINAYQPSGTFTMENFPMEFKQILLDSGLITGVMSQELFAIDNDIPNYNDQGTSFVISHQPQLASFLNAVTQRLDKIIPMMKLQMISPGALHTKMGPSFRMQQLMDAGPSGALYRNIYFSGT